MTSPDDPDIVLEDPARRQQWGRRAAYDDPGVRIARHDQDTRQYQPMPEVGPGRTERQQAPEDKHHEDFPSTPPRTHQWVPGSPKNQGGVQDVDFHAVGVAHGRAAAPQFREQLLNAIDNHLVVSLMEELGRNGIG